MNYLYSLLPESVRNMSLIEMVFLASYLVMAVWGAAVMASGYLYITNEYIVRDLKARLLSLLLLIPIPLSMLLKTIAKSAMDKQAFASSWFMYDMCTIAICGMTFLGLGMFLAPPDSGAPQMSSKGEKRTAAQKRGKK